MVTRQAELRRDGAVGLRDATMQYALRSIINAAVLLFAVPAAAVVAPGIGSLPPGLGGQNGVVGTQIRVAGSVTATSPPPDNVSAPLVVSDGYDFTSNDFSADDLSEARNAAAQINGFSGQAQSSAQVSGGALHAFAKGAIARPDVRGVATADARAFASFTDLITIDANGGDFDLTLSLSGGFGSSGSVFTPKGGSVIAQVWLFAFEPFVPLVPFTSGRNAQYYELKSFNSANVDSLSIALGSTDNLVSGAKFWLHADLEIRATTFWDSRFSPDLNASATTDFSHTLNVYFDPAPNNPNATFTTASGVSYLSPAPVPIPATLCLLAPVLGGLALLRRKAT